MLATLLKRMDPQAKLAGVWSQFLARQLSDLNAQPKPAEQPLAENPYYAKYAEKLRKASATADAAQTNQRLTDEQQSTRAQLDRLNARLEAGRTQSEPAGGRRSSAEPVVAEPAAAEPAAAEPAAAEQAAGGNAAADARQRPSYVQGRTLDEIVRLELLEAHEPSVIREIWSEYHRHKDDCLYACIERETYEQIQKNARLYPIFVFPVPVVEPTPQPTPDGEPQPQPAAKCNYQYVLAQFDDSRIFFTPLVMYQAHGADAPPCLTLNHHAELAASKGLVLLEGEYDRQVFSAFDAQCLANQVPIFYGTQDARRLQLLHRFNREPAAFDHMEIINEFECLSLSTAKK